MDTTHQTIQPDDPAAVRLAARHVYESTPATLLEVAAEFGVTDRTLKRWSAADGGWTKLTGPEITARAQAVADKITAAVAQADESVRPAVTEALRIEAAVDERGAVLARHRSEWSVVRGLVAEAVRSRDGAKAKLAVDVGRALELTQRGECRAYGLDAGETPGAGGVTVIIERG